MRSKFRAIGRYRPRILTLIVFFVIAALIVLANLSFDEGWVGQGTSFRYRSYGWPLVWHRFVAVTLGMTVAGGTVGWYYSASRLAANVAMWLVILAAAASACQWLLRRYRPRPRWTLRTMLAAVALVAACCGWFAAARLRANLQDPIIEARTFPGWGIPGVGLTHRGPQWLDLLGLNRYRRKIVAFGPIRIAHAKEVDGEDAEKLFRQLARLPALRALHLEVDHLTPGMADALNELSGLQQLSITRMSSDDDDYSDEEWDREERLPPIGKLTQLEDLDLSGITLDARSLAGLANLKSLSIDDYGFLWGDERAWRASLEAIGKLTPLQRLELSVPVRSESLAHLAGLANLRSLRMSFLHPDHLLRCLPALASLESLEFVHTTLGSQDLRHLAVLPRLRSLFLDKTSLTAAELAELASLEALEELALDGDPRGVERSCISAVGLRSLLGIKRLKTLHLARNEGGGDYRWATLTLDDGAELRVLEDDLDGFRRALTALRQTHAGIVIDGDASAIGRRNGMGRLVFPDPPQSPITWLPRPQTPWISPSGRADFDARGGWASFDGAGLRDDDGQVVSFAF